MKRTIHLLLLLLVASPFLSAQNLIDAVEAKDYKAVKEYIDKGGKINKPNKEGQFALWAAVWNHDTQMVELLLKNGADAKQKFKGKEAEIACLEISAQEGLLEITQLLADAGAVIDERSFRGITPLRIAARNGRIELVKYFLSKGCDADSKGEDGATPLEVAASKGHMEIVVMLVEKGANVNIQDKEGDTPLGEAAKHGFIEVVNYLLSKGADTSLKNAEGKNAEELARLAGQAKIEGILKQHRKG
jgi:ankyrin repeat protein